MRTIVRKNLSMTIKKGAFPKAPFLPIKEAVLGKIYVLSLVFADDQLSKHLNLVYRGKGKPTNVLSFPLSKNEGEIFINIAQCEKDARKFGQNKKTIIPYMFIHALMHLKGLSHGSKMDKSEFGVRKKFGIAP